jgi:hypothetical protein
MGGRITWVCQNWGIRTIFEHRTTNKHLYEDEHLYF